MLESFVIQLNQNLDELQSFIAQAFSPIKILNSVQVRIIALLEPRNGVTDSPIHFHNIACLENPLEN